MLSLRLITRYYRGEKPYIHYFLKFHRSIGIEEFLILVQNKTDFEDICNFQKDYSDCSISIHLSEVDGSADSVLTELKLNQYPSKSIYSMLIDVDEFLLFDKGSFFASDYHSIKVNWLMTSSKSHHADDRNAFYIPIFKMIAKNESILKIKNPHEFVLRASADSDKYSTSGNNCGLYLLHHWCRSIDDAIIKACIQNIANNPKNIDVIQNGLKFFTNESEIPRRLRYAAYLESQKSDARIIQSSTYSPEYSSSLEATTITELIDEDSYAKLKALYIEYLNFAKQKPHLFPNWPHKTSVNQVCEILPSLKKLRKE